uniref:Calpain catalytic domain-containing protein n=1 Tax=Plectus sambesii TaxID=2011161 RepID=A0A914UYZ2_9BILA
MPSDSHFRGQNYRKLKRQCEKTGTLFVDTEFPASNVSLFLDESRTSNIVWKRPGELVDDPQLFVEGASVNDVTQGILGNCWFVSACSALTHNSHLLKKVIPDPEEQEWSRKDKKRYAGIFRFCFWRFGKWTDVIIDDLLPTRDDKLLFTRSKTSNEFWSALLEKAFAKVYGCYENLVGGQLADALQEVSGGVPETIDMRRFKYAMGENWHLKLFNHLKEAFANKALIVAAIAPKDKDDIEKPLECGLVKGHAYAVTDVRYIELDAKNRGILFFVAAERKLMIRLQNPWGEKEWNGAWSDGSEEWNHLTETRKAELGITVDEDGEFWMPFDEFCEYFTDISVCQLFNTRIFSSSKRYMEATFFGSWKVNGKSGAQGDWSPSSIDSLVGSRCPEQM